MTGILVGTLGEVSVDRSGHVTAMMENPVQVDSLACALHIAGHHSTAQLAEADN